MKRLIISILLVILFTSFCLVPAYAQLPNLSLYRTAANKTQYRLKLEAGKQYYVQIISEQQISSSSTPDKGQSMVMTIGTGAKFDVGNVDANGNAQVTYTYKWIKFGVKGTGGKIEEKVYDSSKEDSNVLEEFKWFALLLEESFSLTISPAGRILEIKDLDKVRSNVQRKLPEGPTKEIAMSSLDQWLNEATLRAGIENSLAIYPDRPVGVGDSWTRNVTLSGSTAMILENKWTLKERKNGVAVIEVVTTIKPNPQAKPVEIGTQGMTSSSEFNGTQQGLIEMQESTGLIIKSNINQQMTGKTTIKNSNRPGSPEIVQPMEIKSVVTTVTSDWENAKSTIGTSTGAVTQEQPRRERPLSPRESFQRRANLSAASSTSPYLIDDEEGSTPPPRQRSRRQTFDGTIHDAVISGDVAKVESILSQGTDINSLNRSRWTPLHVAIFNRKKEIAELLINKGADLNAQNNRQQTPLVIAVDTGQKEIVELLISKGADVNILAGGDNALTIARKKNYTELVNILVENGAKEPSPQDLLGDRYYGEQASPYSAYPGQTNTQTRNPRGYSNVQPVEVDILADPNEIIARIKTFAGLQETINVVDANSRNEMRQWLQTRYDNRTMLLRYVQRQFEEEMNLIRTVSVSEKAKKTTAAIDSALSLRQERFKTISKELMAQRREQRQAEQLSGRTRGRGRTTSRGSRGGYGSQGNQYDGGYDSYSGYGRGSSDPYGRGGVSSRSRYPGTTGGLSPQTAQPVDIEAENEKNQWLQASFDNKSDLASAVNDQIQLEVTAIRDIAVEEKAKKTTAAIDGVLLVRKIRLDAYLLKMQEQQLTSQQQYDPRSGGRYQQDSRYNRGGTTGGYQQGGQSGRTRRRR